MLSDAGRARRAADRAARRGAGADRPERDSAPRGAAQRQVGRSSTGSTRPQAASTRLVDEAIEIAREVDAPATLAAALHRKIFIPIGPDAAARAAGDRRRDARAGRALPATARPCSARHAYRLWSYLELGDVAAVDRELAAYARLADELRMPEHSWHTPRCAAMRALLDGDIEEAERLAERGAARRASAPSSRSPSSSTGSR